ncbi:hypothetical protein SELMODRAFT_441949 [Selaginella moellendorffii]|uniref:DRBM domain-containing protein n=1 Tax=Selaginella moellendorffii TaxID=88036 RepID=D8RP21_SELML|nr:double-stranded RNA-binding protein 3 [Selaginella moellendorffii]XP_002993386.1 double-stranded RNA-binding protein 3 [Selaginella moellendorffii]EFJ05571.1 hypothetical protein SELMODRAFT_431451 [Selaginella moellendorffii]EFJ26186.1 hypothetical protein SELMODRAFT_441949 [Selaginella moellendorffii]|eukprot:XP_002972965.1 double-stranded RNA-binding protein 3 [Selaginella moellendorffii]
MYKNQLQELAQRSCFNLPAYSCIREGPDHAPRFKAAVNFNGEVFESPNYCSTLRQAEHAAAELALNVLSRRGPSQSLAARILDETGVFKNLLQETAQRANVPLPTYTTTRSGPGHLPVFTCVVEVAGMNFTGDAGKTKKQAEKNAAMAAWATLKQFAKKLAPPSLFYSDEMTEDQEQISIARVLYLAYEKVGGGQASRPRQYTVPSLFDKDCTVGYLGSQQQHLRSGAGFCSTNPRSSNPEALALPRDIRAYGMTHPRVRTRNVQLTHEVPPPIEEHRRDEEDWLRGESSSSSSTCASSSRPMPEEPKRSSRSPMFWPRTTDSHWWQSDSSLLSSGYHLRRPQVSLAPPVRVRSVVAVSAAPPQRSQPQEAADQDGLSDGLSRLNL